MTNMTIMNSNQEDSHLLQDILHLHPMEPLPPTSSGLKDSSISTERLQPRQGEGTSLSQNSHMGKKKLTKRRLLPLFFIVAYAFILLFSWILTCVLAFKPIIYSRWDTSYTSPRIRPCLYYQHDGSTAGITGFDCDGLIDAFTPQQLDRNDQVRVAIRFLGSLAAVAAIPLSSAVCARAAVSYVQSLPDGHFRLKKILALADRGWWDPVILGKLFTPQGMKQQATKFLVLSTVVCALGAVIWPLQGVLVGQESIHIVSLKSNFSAIGRDADITGLSQVEFSNAVSDTAAFIDVGSPYDTEPNLWKYDRCRSFAPTEWPQTCVQGDVGNHYYYLWGNRSFVSYIVNSVNTGLFEIHSFQFNSTVSCDVLPEEEFPDACGSPESFATSSITNMGGSDLGNGTMEFHVCVPRDSSQFPWNITRDRQDIEEAIYFHFNHDAMRYLTNGTTTKPVTRKCVARTTAGYFMLPNTANKDPGPVLDKFDLASSHDPKTVNVNDSTIRDPRYILGEGLPHPKVTESATQGPLLVAARSIFGPSSFFSIRANASMSPSDIPLPPPSPLRTENCTVRVPFNYIDTSDEASYSLNPCTSDSPDMYFGDLSRWLATLFAREKYNPSTEIFTMAVYYANKANLQRAATIQDYHRTMMTDPGTMVQKPTVQLWAVIFLSVIIVLHLAGLISLAIYTARHPSWTETLDSLAVLRLGASLVVNRVGAESGVSQDSRYE